MAPSKRNATVAEAVAANETTALNDASRDANGKKRKKLSVDDSSHPKEGKATTGGEDGSQSKNLAREILALIRVSLPEACHNGTSATNEPTTIPLASNNPQEDLQALRGVLGSLTQVQNELLSMEKTVEEKIRNLHRESSPLLSMDDNILCRVVSYLDEVNLEAFEGCCTGALNSSSCWVMNKQWEYLDALRKQRDAGGQFCRTQSLSERDRGLRYAQASTFARQMQEWGNIHYQPIYEYASRANLQRQPTNQDLYTRNDFRSGFERWQEEQPGHDYPSCEFFVRVTYQDDMGTITCEGFVDLSTDEDGCGMHVEPISEQSTWITITDGSLFSEIRERIMDPYFQDWQSSFLREELLRRLTVTIIAVPTRNYDPTDMKLVITTTGSYGNHGAYAMFPPRNTHYIDATGIDPHDEAFVTLGFNVDFDSNDDGGIVLLLEWGAYNNV